MPVVTITNNGVSPSNVRIPVGGTVRFMNQSSSFHDVESDPHPVHTDCPPINQVGLLAAGQSRQTGTFGSARTCGYHDHLDPLNPAFQGTITVGP